MGGEVVTEGVEAEGASWKERIEALKLHSQQDLEGEDQDSGTEVGAQFSTPTAWRDLQRQKRKFDLT